MGTRVEERFSGKVPCTLYWDTNMQVQPKGHPIQTLSSRPREYTIPEGSVVKREGGFRLVVVEGSSCSGFHRTSAVGPRRVAKHNDGLGDGIILALLFLLGRPQRWLRRILTVALHNGRGWRLVATLVVRTRRCLPPEAKLVGSRVKQRRHILTQSARTCVAGCD